jgi:serine protease
MSKTQNNNKVTFSATLLSLAISASLHAAPVIDESKNSTLPKRYIVKYKSGTVSSLMNESSGVSHLAQSRMSTLGVKNAQFKPSLNAIVTPLTSDQLQTLQEDSNVEYVEEDLPRRLMSQEIPYGISLVQADLVDDMVASAASGGKKICVIDSGLDLPHEDMGSNGGTITGTNDRGTGNWYEHGGPHGTHVAGTIAALNNGIGVRGVIGTDPSMHIIKVFNADGWGYSSELVDAVNKCQAAGADVVNMSLGGSGSSTTERNGMQAAADAGMLLIAAAGNDGVLSNPTDLESFPASYDSVMSVGGVDKNKDLYVSSQKNDQVEIAAPGVDVQSAYPEGDGSLVTLAVNGVSYETNALENQGIVTASLYDFAKGLEQDSGASGKVCLIQRGEISFHDKVKNCEDSGGLGAIIYNNAAGSFSGTLGDSNQTTIPSLTVSDTAGAAMLTALGTSAALNISPGNYGKMTGTSMASPHVAGVAALVWSHHPSCTADQIRTVLTATAEDLGAPGRDVQFGYGLVQAKAALDYLNENGCSGEPGGTLPVIDETVNNINVSRRNWVRYTVDLPEGYSNLNVSMSGGTGDADLYVTYGKASTRSQWDCRPYVGGNVENCTFPSPQAGTWHIDVYGYSAAAGVTLNITATTSK